MTIPTPGSQEAINKGCTCPIMDNNGGRGFGDPPMYWVNNNCPLHGDKGWRREILESERHKMNFDSLRLQAITKCRDRIEKGEKRVMPSTLPRMKARYGI